MYNPVIKALAEKHERVWNLYTIGPVQKAEVETFVEDIVRQCAKFQHERFCEYGDVQQELLLEYFGIK
jgi:hypothetical protein